MGFAAIAAGIAGLLLLLTLANRKTTPKTKLVNMLAPGTRVVVASGHFWARRATGAVWMPPDDLKRLAPEWVDITRTFTTQKGDHTTYWVVFDQPQPYPDGDGPFIAAEVQATALAPVEAATGAGIRRSEYFGPGELVFSWFENPKLGYRVEFKAKRKVK
jgi:hypothetical protein